MKSNYTPPTIQCMATITEHVLCASIDGVYSAPDSGIDNFSYESSTIEW